MGIDRFQYHIYYRNIVFPLIFTEHNFWGGGGLKFND